MIQLRVVQHIKDVIQGKTTLKNKRSKHWPKYRKHHLKKYPNCALCGGSKKVEVHHLEPFHLNPEKELDLENLISLCESKKWGINCHLFAGHLGNYRTANLTCREDATFWNIKLTKKAK